MNRASLADLAELARQRRSALDEEIAAWRRGPGAGVRLWCGPGCGNCCTLAVNATLPEALVIAGRLDGPQRLLLSATVARLIDHAGQCRDPRTFLAGYRQAVGPCPFLDELANCIIYPERPLACRALLATRPPDWCGVNLAELDEFDRTSFLAGLDRSVVAFPTHYAAAPQQLAADYERGLLFAMLRLAGYALSGNLALLTWLCGEPGFTAALLAGPEDLRCFLSARRADQPFLVQIEAP